MLVLVLAAALGSGAGLPPAPAPASALAPASPLTDLAPAATDPTPGAVFSPAEPRVPSTYFGARYYGSRIARFTTVDPVYNWKENLVDPQRWNRYAYGRNNPLRYVDPDGKDVFTQQEVFQAASEYQRGEITFQQYQGHMNAIGASGVIGTGVLAAVAAGFAAPQLLAAAAVKAADPRTQEMIAGLAEAVSGAAPGSLSVGAAIAAQAQRAGARLAEGVALTAGQGASLGRFMKKLPTGNTGTYVDQLGDQVLFTAEVPGRVAGSKAVYQKAVDAAGKATSFVKTTFDPKGSVVHVKDKLGP